METLKHLPNIEGRKYGTISIGYDRIDQMRMEVSTLETLVALVCGCPREALTIQTVQKSIAEIQAAMSALTDQDRADWRDEDAMKLVAVAVDKLRA